MEQIAHYNGSRNGRANKHILIVDDDTEICDLLELTFQRKGYRTEAAYSGGDALRIAGERVPDLVILDVMMPKRDGWETFEALRAVSTVPVLFLTSLVSGEYASRALEFRGTDYVRKPHSIPELIARVEKLLRAVDEATSSRTVDASTVEILPQPSIAAVIPAYDEERFIGSVVLRARKSADVVIVIDDGSTDSTIQVAQDAGAVVISHQTNQGKAKALETGFKRARELGASVIVMLDADGQHNPTEIPVLAKPILEGEADMVIGSRFSQIRSDIPVWRQFGQHALTLATNVASGVATTDSQSGFRAFSRDVLEQVQIRSSRFTVESEMQFWLREHKFRVIEAPISVVYEEKSKRNPFGHALQVLFGLYELVSEARPLFFFSFIGMVLQIGGLLWWGWIVQNYSNTSELALGYALIATLLVILGTLAFFLGIILHNLRRIMQQLLSRAVEVGRRQS